MRSSMAATSCCVCGMKGMAPASVFGGDLRLVGRGVEQAAHAGGVVRPDLEKPGAVGVLIHQFGLVGRGLVDRRHLAGQRRVDVRGGLHRFDDCAFLALGHVPADLGQFEEDDVAEQFLGILRTILINTLSSLVEDSSKE